MCGVRCRTRGDAVVAGDVDGAIVWNLPLTLLIDQHAGEGVAGLASINATVLGVNLGLWPLPLFVVFFGFGFGSSIPLRLSILGDYFGRASYGSIVGLMSSVNAIFGAAGPAMVGLIYDLKESYRLGFTILTIVLVISIPLALGLEPAHRVAAKARAITRRSYRERNRSESN